MFNKCGKHLIDSSDYDKKNSRMMLFFIIGTISLVVSSKIQHSFRGFNEMLWLKIPRKVHIMRMFITYI